MTEPAWRAEKRRLVERYREENRSAVLGGVVFAGSSLMEMFPVQDWARELPGCPPVYNRGVGGYRTEDMLPLLDVLVTDLMPRRVFINIGTNDLSDPAVTIDALMGRYGEILRVIGGRVPGVEIILMAYYPVNYDAADEGMKATLRVRTNARICEANRAVSALAARLGCRFCDFNAPLKDEAGRLNAEYTIEGMHLREEGYRAIWPLVTRELLR
ncbi:MAG: lysophospholipase [Clostridia bacterium]|nr:lysophospholipase [Clostridia bacterium]